MRQVKGRQFDVAKTVTNKEVEMPGSQSDPRIELRAAKIAIKWMNGFAEELDTAAREAAMNSDFVSEAHYRQALPLATARLLAAIETNGTDSGNAQQRVA
jgi:hypothetical protein